MAMLRRLIANTIRRFTSLALLLGFVAVLGGFALPWIQIHSMLNSPWAVKEFWYSWGFETFMLAWAFFVGASLGSFINVVAYRLPNKISLNGSSFCPRCRVPIRMRDNIPVFGWLNLRGRCRTCRLPISPRYPIFEAVAGLIGLLIYIVVVVGHGWNLPMPHDTHMPWGVASHFSFLDPVYFYHATYFSIAILWLFASYLTRGNGQQLPASAWFSIITIAIVAQLIEPRLGLRPEAVPEAMLDGMGPWTGQRSIVIVSMLIGFIVGFIVACMASFIGGQKWFRTNPHNLFERESIGGWLLIGVVFGSRFTLLVFGINALVSWSAKLNFKRVRDGVWLNALVLFLGWRFIDARLADISSGRLAIVYGLIFLFSLIVLRISASLNHSKEET
jgi:hypothetical protein